MRLYLTANTNIPDVVIDFIEVRLKTGEKVSLNWDESDISRTDTGFDARYKGVYFGDKYADGRISDLEDLEILDIGLYFEASGSFEFKIAEMEFEDGDKLLTVSQPMIPQRCSGLEGLKPKSLSDQIKSASIRAAESHFADKTHAKESAPER